MFKGEHGTLARIISAIEAGRLKDGHLVKIREAAAQAKKAPVLGITGTGGAGKSSLTDELIRRLRQHSGEPRIAVIAIDPIRRKTGGALLGDRIRMNAIAAPNIYFRSLTTRTAANEVPEALPDIIAACKAAGFELVIVETPGIGQGDAGIVPVSDVSIYVMTPEFGAASQLEKIDMLDYADVVAINKFDRRGAADALRDVSKQYQRNHKLFSAKPEDMPVFGTIASRFDDQGVTALSQTLLRVFNDKGFGPWRSDRKPLQIRASEPGAAIVPPKRQRYLAEVAECVRGYHKTVAEQVAIARERQHLREAKRMLDEAGADTAALEAACQKRQQQLDPRAARLIELWPEVQKAYAGDEYVVKIRGQERRNRLTYETLSGTRIPKVALPNYQDRGRDPQMAAEGERARQLPLYRRRVRLQARQRGPDPHVRRRGRSVPHQPAVQISVQGFAAKRLSTAFDSVTLYGWDPEERPDIYGKVGNSGVSIATLDDMKTLYAGFDLCDPSTSVSMTINGPAPTILAMFFNTAIDQQLEQVPRENKRAADRRGGGKNQRVDAVDRARHRAGRHPEGGPGAEHLHLLHRVRAADDGRHPGIFRAARGAEFLFGVDLRLPHRRGRREPDLAARLHHGQRLHLCGGLSGARHAHRQLRAQPVVLLLQRHGRRILRARPRRAPHLGGRPCASNTAPTSARRSSNTTPRPPAARCTRRRWISTTSAPRCRR